MLENQELFGMYSKEEQAIKSIQLHEPKEGYYVCFSGGKDSTVIYDLVKRAKVKFTVEHSLTGIEPPELIYFIRKNYPEVKTINPNTTIWQLIIKNKYPPTRIARYCCRELKENGGNGFFKVTGIRHEESVKRSKRKYFEPCMNNRGTRYLNPIIEWTKEEVWEYIHKYNLPYCKLYDEGFTRIGCIFCPMASVKEKKEWEIRYPKYKEQFIRTFDKMLKDKKFTSDSSKWKTGIDVFNWWCYGEKKEDNEQGIIPLDFI